MEKHTGSGLLCWSRRSNRFPYKKQYRFPEIAEVHLLEDAVHMGMIEEPEKTLEIVAKFANLSVKTGQT